MTSPDDSALKRSPSFWLGPGASDQLLAIAAVDEDEEPGCDGEETEDLLPDCTGRSEIRLATSNPAAMQ